MKRMTVLLGNYGSGKTELALNLALQAAENGEDVTLVDLDIVNPYFRSSEYHEMLEDKGVRVIAPVYANTGVDLPTLPGEVHAAFGAPRAVLDCGGDAVGATALGSLKARLDAVREDVDVLFVVNTNRPYQQSADQLAQSLEVIQQAARITADGIVFNANLGAETTGQELVDGFDIVQAFSQRSGLPIVAVSGTESALRVFKQAYPKYDGEYICMGIHTRPVWME